MSNKSRKDRRGSVSTGRRDNSSPTSSLVLHQKIVTWRSGPIPPHEELVGYENLLPGSANRILNMAEQQSKHRHNLENMILRHDIIKSYAGLICGGIICLAGFFTAYKIVELGHPAAGGLFGSVPLAGLVAAFFKATNLRQRERDFQRGAVDKQTQRPPQ